MTVLAARRGGARLLAPHRIFLALIFAGAGVLGWAVLPGEPERIAMLERDGKLREA